MTGATWSDDVTVRVEASAAQWFAHDGDTPAGFFPAIPDPTWNGQAATGDVPRRWEAVIGGSGAAVMNPTFDLTGFNMSANGSPWAQIGTQATRVFRGWRMVDPETLPAGDYAWHVWSYSRGLNGQTDLADMRARVVAPDGSFIKAERWTPNDDVAVEHVVNFTLTQETPIKLEFAGLETRAAGFCAIYFSESNVYTKAAGPPPITWTPITCDTLEASIEYGRPRIIEPFEVATCTFRLGNDSGRYGWTDPLAIGHRVRVVAEHGGSDHPLFYGIVDTLDFDYTPSGERQSVTVSAFDPTSILAATTIDEQSGRFGTAAAIITRLATDAGWPRAFIDVPSSGGHADLDQKGPNPQESDAREIAVTAALTADMDFYADRIGRLVAVPRGLNTAAPAIKLHASQAARPAGPVVCPTSLETERSLANTVTDTRFKRPKHAGDPDDVNLVYHRWLDDEIERYGIRSKSWSTFARQTIDMAPLGLTVWKLVAGSNGDVERVTAAEWSPVNDPNTWPIALDLWLGDRAHVTYGHPSGLWGWSCDADVQSIVHDIDPAGWRVTIGLDGQRNFTRNGTPP